MKDKIKIEDFVEENKQSVFVDQCLQVKKLNEQLSYISKIKNESCKKHKQCEDKIQSAAFINKLKKDEMI